jgi:hypothetical protein
MSGTDRGEQPVTDNVDRTQRVYLYKQTTCPVLTGQWAGLLRIDLEPTPDHFFGVVCATLFVGATQKPGNDGVGVSDEFDD